MRKQIQDWIEKRLNQFKIVKKLRIIYIICVLIPLFLTDGVILGVVFSTEKANRQHEMERVASAVYGEFYNDVENAQQLAKSVYTSKHMDNFFHRKFTSNLDYYNQYNAFFSNTLFDIAAGQNNSKVTFFLDNDTIVGGSQFQKVEKAMDQEWYQYMEANQLKKGVFFGYVEHAGSAVGRQRAIYFFQKLDFYGDTKSVFLITLDYSSLVRTLKNISDTADVFICDDEYIYLTNGKYGSVAKDYQSLENLSKRTYVEERTLYGEKLQVIVNDGESVFFRTLMRHVPALLILIIANVLLPYFMMESINRSFTVRLQELSDSFEHVNEEKLLPIDNPRGEDEIGLLMSNYNRMVDRTNDLIQIVYKNKIHEQEMLVARQNAELLALHSQVNPHFLFNALESIRMHSLLKRETETADMVEKLAKMQRQYVEWQDDTVLIEKELELVSAYLGLQKYRFGDRLSYEIEVEEGCQKYYIPTLSIVTFVENACIHGIESKTVPGWIFVRITSESGILSVEIEDTGNGMEEDKVEDFKYRMENANINMLKEKGRVGIVNAALRLKMVSKETVKFDVESEQGIGTIVSFKIPLEYVKGIQ